jgi:hypothetical protein
MIISWEIMELSFTRKKKNYTQFSGIEKYDIEGDS